VSNDTDCRRLAAGAVERYGRIDALVNSAGTTRVAALSDLDAIDATEFQRVIAVNTVGAFQMARAVSRAMLSTGGAIVNVSSIASTTGTGSSYAYVASKGALNALTIALARNLAPSIRVNAVLPGLIEGRWLEERLGAQAYEQVKVQYAASSALGRVCTPEDVAETIGWLIVSAPALTGQLITLDAGMTLGRPLEVLR
jgi:3-oxoacyl-[acyl-carrier protein] reductase